MFCNQKGVFRDREASGFPANVSDMVANLSARRIAFWGERGPVNNIWSCFALFWHGFWVEGGPRIIENAIFLTDCMVWRVGLGRRGSPESLKIFRFLQIRNAFGGVAQNSIKS